MVKTWHMATGTTSWSYTWATQTGTYNISVKVTDNYGTTQITSHTVVVSANPLLKNPDILWRHSSGTNAVWYMNGVNLLDYGFLDSVSDANWQIVDISDFNGDGN